MSISIDATTNRSVSIALSSDVKKEFSINREGVSPPSVPHTNPESINSHSFTTNETPLRATNSWPILKVLNMESVDLKTIFSSLLPTTKVLRPRASVAEPTPKESSTTGFSPSLSIPTKLNTWSMPVEVVIARE